MINFLLKNQLRVKKVLFYLSALLIILSMAGIYLIYSRHQLAANVFEVGSQLGKLALIFYTLTLLPGIAQRFKISGQLISLLMVFRRQLGVLTYILVFTHFMYLRGSFSLLSGSMSLRSTFEQLGLLALLTLTPLFLTSTDAMVKLLGKWWKRLHRLTYLALALVFLHVALQDMSIWSLLAAVVLAAELGSWIYYYKNKLSKKADIPLQS